MGPLKRRDMILVLATVIVFSMTAWRILNPRGRSSVSAAVPQNLQPAPAFELYDQNSRLVKLDAYLHRHTVVLIFFDRQEDPGKNPILKQLTEFHEALQRNGVIVIAVSNALPQQIRNATAKPFPFPILSDVTPERPGSASQLWGRFGPGGITPGIFLIDRSGLVAWMDGLPAPSEDIGLVIRRLMSGG